MQITKSYTVIFKNQISTTIQGAVGKNFSKINDTLNQILKCSMTKALPSSDRELIWYAYSYMLCWLPLVTECHNNLFIFSFCKERERGQIYIFNHIYRQNRLAWVTETFVMQ
jgi:hypothetical protein